MRASVLAYLKHIGWSRCRDKRIKKPGRAWWTRAEEETFRSPAILSCVCVCMCVTTPRWTRDFLFEDLYADANLYRFYSSREGKMTPGCRPVIIYLQTKKKKTKKAREMMKQTGKKVKRKTKVSATFFVLWTTRAHTNRGWAGRTKRRK